MGSISASTGNPLAFRAHAQTQGLLTPAQTPWGAFHGPHSLGVASTPAKASSSVTNHRIPTSLCHLLPAPEYPEAHRHQPAQALTHTGHAGPQLNSRGPGAAEGGLTYHALSKGCSLEGGQAQVANLYRAGGSGDEDVVTLEVAMDDGGRSGV